MVTVLITGGAGYIGSVLAGMLLNAKCKVKVLDRLFFGIDPVKAYLDSNNFELIKDDIRYCDEKVFKGVDVVMDLAGISNDPSCDLNPAITLSINVKGSTRIARFAKKMGVSRYIYSSSCSVYGAGISLSEEAEENPVSLYAKSKLKCEKDLMDLNDEHFTVTCLRNATVYGISKRMRFDLVVNLMTLTAFKNGRIHLLGGGKQWRPNIHVSDCARAFMLVMQSPKKLVSGECFNAGGNEQNYQIFQIAKIVQNYFPDTEVETVADDPDKRDYKVNFDKIESTLNFKPIKTIESGVAEIKEALERDLVRDDIKTVTLNYYKYLVDAERVLKEVKYRGRIF